MKKPKKTDFIIDLETNAFSSLRHGIEHFINDETTENLKFSIIHIFHAVELFLKARLVKAHELLIYVKPEDKIGDNSHTVCFDVLIKRLENSGVTLLNSDKRILKMLQHTRNAIEHHKVNKNKGEVRLYVGRAAKFLDNFLNNELDIKLKENIDTTLYQTLSEAIYSYEERLKKAEEEISQSLPVKPKEKMDYYYEICPNCGENTIVIPDPKDESQDNKTHCFFCGQQYFYEYCIKCSSPVLSSEELEQEDFNPCSDCWQDLMTDE